MLADVLCYLDQTSWKFNKHEDAKGDAMEPLPWGHEDSHFFLSHTGTPPACCLAHSQITNLWIRLLRCNLWSGRATIAAVRDYTWPGAWSGEWVNHRHWAVSTVWERGRRWKKESGIHIRTHALSLHGSNRVHPIFSWCHGGKTTMQNPVRVLNKWCCKVEAAKYLVS